MKRTLIMSAVLFAAIVGGIVASASGIVNVVEAKKSYKLIVYLDGAFEPNNLPSFKVVVYNSDHKKILSDKV